jgi:hypothetical protein
MGTNLKGVNISGAQIKGQRTFAFFPGLELWLEEGMGVTTFTSGVGVGRVDTLRDQSNNSRVFQFQQSSSSNRNPIVEGDNLNCKSGTTFSGVGRLTENPNTGFGFLSGRYKRGVYMILKTKYNATDGEVIWDPFRTGFQGSGQPDSMRIRFNNNTRAITYTIRNNGTNVSRTTPVDSFSDDTYFLYRNILKTNNTTENHRQIINNTVVRADTENRSYPNLTHDNTDALLTQANAQNTDKNFRLMLAYNWENYTDAQIDEFDAGIINVMRNSEKFSSLITW